MSASSWVILPKLQRGHATHLNTTELHNLLLRKPGRYIEHRMGVYVMREANGAAVTFTEGGEGFPIQPPESLIDHLVDAGHLVREGSKYWPRP